MSDALSRFKLGQKYDFFEMSFEENKRILGPQLAKMIEEMKLNPTASDIEFYVKSVSPETGQITLDFKRPYYPRCQDCGAKMTPDHGSEDCGFDPR